MEAKASIKNVPVAPRKARLVADLVRDRFVEDALNQLAFLHKSTSAVIRKLIRSTKTQPWMKAISSSRKSSLMKE